MQEESRLALVALLTGAVGISFAPIFVRLSEVGPSATALLRVKNLRRSFSTATIMAWSGLSASPALFLVALASGERLVPTHVSGWIVVIALALISQVGGQSLIAYAFAHLPASFSSLSLLLQPAVAALLAWIILAEPLGLFQAFGGTVILCGIAVASRADR